MSKTLVQSMDELRDAARPLRDAALAPIERVMDRLDNDQRALVVYVAGYTLAVILAAWTVLTILAV